MFGISYWAVPIFSAVVWTAMLITMLVYWATTGRPVYQTMEGRRSIPFISDIGHGDLKPMFIAMGAITVVSFDLAFLFERWLRHSGRLSPNTSVWQKVYSACATLAAIAGAAGLILLTIFDNLHHSRLHNIFLAIFIIGYIVSAIFICWEYQRLGIRYREHSVLRYSFWIKLFFILFEIALCIGFGVCQLQDHDNAAAILEWLIAFIYGFFVISFFMDFLPAVRTKHHKSSQSEMQMAEEGGAALGDGAAEAGKYFRGNPATNGHVNGHTNGHVAQPAPAASRNF